MSHTRVENRSSGRAYAQTARQSRRPLGQASTAAHWLPSQLRWGSGLVGTTRLARTRRDTDPDALGPGSVIAFAWGRAGPGARELARSILHDATGDPELSERISSAFVREIVVQLPDVGFELDREDVLAWVSTQERAEPAKRIEVMDAGIGADLNIDHRGAMSSHTITTTGGSSDCRPDDRDG